MSNDRNKELSLGDRIFGAAMSRNPDAHSSFTRSNPSVGERAVGYGALPTGVDFDAVADLLKRGS